MKRIMAGALLAFLMLGCQSETQYGDCIGAFDDDSRKAGLDYDLSIRNTILGIVFIETIIVPVWIIADETLCPVGPR